MWRWERAGGLRVGSRRCPIFFLNLFIFNGGARSAAPHPRRDFMSCAAKRPCLYRKHVRQWAQRLCSGQYRADYWKPYWFFCRCSGGDNAANKVNISLCCISIYQFIYWWSNWIGLRTITFFFFFTLVHLFNATNSSFVWQNNTDSLTAFQSHRGPPM